MKNLHILGLLLLLLTGYGNIARPHVQTLAETKRNTQEKPPAVNPKPATPSGKAGFEVNGVQGRRGWHPKSASGWIPIDP